MTVGTVSYAAPEQLMGDELDGRADQYALAATAFHLLTGSPPFQHSNPAVVISQHLGASPPAIGDRRPDLRRSTRYWPRRWRRTRTTVSSGARTSPAPSSTASARCPTRCRPHPAVPAAADLPADGGARRSRMRPGVVVPAVLAVLLVAAIAVAAAGVPARRRRGRPRRARRRARPRRVRPSPTPPVTTGDHGASPPRRRHPGRARHPDGTRHPRRGDRRRLLAGRQHRAPPPTARRPTARRCRTPARPSGR